MFPYTEEGLERTKRSLLKHSLILIALIVLLIVEITLVLLLQTRETMLISIIVGTVLSFLLFFSIDFVLFLFVIPDRKKIKLISKALNQDSNTDKVIGTMLSAGKEKIVDFLPVTEVEIDNGKYKRIAYILKDIEQPNPDRKYEFVIQGLYLVSYKEVQDEAE